MYINKSKMVRNRWCENYCVVKGWHNNISMPLRFTLTYRSFVYITGMKWNWFTATKHALFKVRITIGMECVHVPNACQNSMKRTLYATRYLMQ